MSAMWLSAVLVALAVVGCRASGCNRMPDSHVPPTPNNGRFRLSISGNPSYYTPSEQYGVSLHVSNKNGQYHFTAFTITLESSEEGGDPGTLTFMREDRRVIHHEKCPNTLVQRSSIAKSEVKVQWTAPPPGSGCVTFKATVIEQANLWYMNDEGLILVLCEEVQNQDTQLPEINTHCCACDEAKYEMTFEGLWSRYTHPNAFPKQATAARFSDVIGASHTVSYNFWQYGKKASKGLQQLAEKGVTILLESELKNKSSEIRTIIKARGISYPNVTGKTFAVFRVDQKHHLISVVSMINPSPDWIVGVAGLELCNNCKWVESLVLDLYPYDVGTNSGLGFEDTGPKTFPHDVIRRITSSYPKNESSPFYDPEGTPIKPLARLYLTRQRLYEKSCNEENRGLTYEDEQPDHDNQESVVECRTGEWSTWGPCSSTCGKGVMLRQRFFLDQSKAELIGCKVVLTARLSCTADQPICKSDELSLLDDAFCRVSEWSEWSACSSTCGQGTRLRTRNYILSRAFKWCSVLPGAPKLQQTETCEPSGDFCENQYPKAELMTQDDPDCPLTEWSEWSACSVTCGTGIRVRTRYLLAQNQKELEMLYSTMHKWDMLTDTSVPECSHMAKEEQIACRAPTESCELTQEQAKAVSSIGKLQIILACSIQPKLNF